MTEFTLDTSRFDGALDIINGSLRTGRCPKVEVESLPPLPKCETLAELLTHYDKDKPLLNARLMLLAKLTIQQAPNSVTLSSPDELEAPSSDVHRFFHGDVTFTGDLDIPENLWITGNLSVEGIIETSLLGDQSDFLVGGDLSCRAVDFRGQTLIAGDLNVERFAWIRSEGSHVVAGALNTHALLGDKGSLHSWETSNVEWVVDLELDDPDDLSKALNLPFDGPDEYCVELVFRALDEARAS